MTISESSALYPQNANRYSNASASDKRTAAKNPADRNVANKDAANPSAKTEKKSTVNPSAKTEKKSADPNKVKKPGRRSSPADCRACAERKYQDGSNEGNVSFKSAAHISPGSAASKVRAHENEHVSNAYKKASQADGKVLNASVSLHTAVCPECGRVYVSGGVTKTTIKYPDEKNPYMQNRKSLDAAKYRGANVDSVA